MILCTQFDAIDFIRDSGLTLYVEPGRSLMDQCEVKDAIKAELDGSLIKDYLNNEDRHANGNDPFPQWFNEAA